MIQSILWDIQVPELENLFNYFLDNIDKAKKVHQKF